MINEDDQWNLKIKREIEELKEEAVIRKKAMVEFKITGKSGTQVKDEGLLYLRWSLSQSASQCNTDYISYVRGKSNVVQVFDTMTESIWSQKKYSMGGQIKGLATLGKDIFDLRHIIIDEKGKLIVDKIAQQNKQSKKEEKYIAEWDLSLIPGSKVTCMVQNALKQNEVAIGTKDTLL